MENHPADLTVSVEDGDSENILLGFVLVMAPLSSSPLRAGSVQCWKCFWPAGPCPAQAILHRRVSCGAGLVVLHQLGILGKHGITIEKEARMHCGVNE